MTCQEILMGTMVTLCAEEWDRRDPEILQNCTTVREVCALLWSGVSRKFSQLGAIVLIWFVVKNFVKAKVAQMVL